MMIEQHEQLVMADVASPVGLLTVVASDCGVRAVLWPGDGPDRVQLSDRVVVVDNPIVEQARRELGEYFAGTRTSFDVPLDPVGTDFQQQAWIALRTIPFGETVSYGEQAARIGDKRKARAVGAANGKNPISIIVPCHRVVGSDGSLTGFAGGIDAKRFLLDHERRVAGHTLI
jgi:methylated-DNA-[protein]-cysteine S-methyltransferase